VGRRDVEDAVHLQNRSRQTRRAARRSRHGHRLLSHTASDGGRTGRRAEPAALAGVRSGRQAPHPGEGQVPNVGLVDLSEGAVPALRVVARVGRPRVRRQTLAYQRPVRQTERNQKQQRGCLHFNVTRYAVRSWMSASRHRGSLSICHCNGLVTTTLGTESCRAKLRYLPSGSRRATTKAEMWSRSPVVVCPEGSVTVTVVGGTFGPAAPAGRRPKLLPPPPDTIRF